LAVGAGAAGVGALNLLGSDTLKDMTVQVLTAAAPDCGGGGLQGGALVYLGTGSGDREAALGADQPAGAPTSPAPDQPRCGASQATAEGIVFSLDGLSVVADQPKWNTCNGTTAGCLLDSPGVGVSHNKVIDPYVDFAGTSGGACTVDADCNMPKRPGFFTG